MELEDKLRLEEAVARLMEGEREGNISGSSVGAAFGRGGTPRDVQYIYRNNIEYSD